MDVGFYVWEITLLKHWEPSRPLANMQEGFFAGRRKAEE
jgi:hypothetical protein